MWGDRELAYIFDELHILDQMVEKSRAVPIARVTTAN